MRRRFVRWCINWWADAEQPEWLRSAIKRDRKLRLYESDLTSLARRLSDDAPSWAECADDAAQSDAFEAKVRLSPQEPTVKKGDPAGRLCRVIGAVIAASILVSFTISPFRDSRHTSDELLLEPNLTAKVDGIIDETVALVVAGVDWMESVDDSVVSWSAAVDSSSMRYADAESIRNAMKRPVESASRKYG